MASSQLRRSVLLLLVRTPTKGFFTGGAQIGYNWQFGNGLFGLEADVIRQ